MNILLAVTGSVAALKVHKIVSELYKNPNVSVRVVATDAGKYFLTLPSVDYDEMVELYYTDEYHPNYKIGKPIDHIELRNWADILVVAPLTANTLAKFANGLCDNIVTNIYRAWDESKPVIVAPAMNTMMWEKCITVRQIQELKESGVYVCQPVWKKLACGDEGIGAMADVSEIVNKTLLFSKKNPPVSIQYLPVDNHPGSFGFDRKRYKHTGVDLYSYDGEIVRAIEHGTVVKIDDFTGSNVGSDWWENTKAVMIEGSSGVFLYGEIEPNQCLYVGYKVNKNEPIGKVRKVLKRTHGIETIPFHSPYMLHLELYEHGNHEFGDWYNDRPKGLLDPTNILYETGHYKKINMNGIIE